MFQKFMGNKDFHPSNIRNLKKLWEAEENEKLQKKKEEELRAQHRKEQEVYQNKEALGRANPLSFMYDPPPGFSQEEGKAGGGVKGEGVRFDWQRQDKPPSKEEAAKTTAVPSQQQQPFGVEVRRVKCLRCGQKGHTNTDRICPMFGQSRTQEELESSLPRSSLADLDTAEDGFIFKQCVRDRLINSGAANQQILGSDDDDEDYSHQILDQLSDRDKRKLLKKIKKMERKQKKKKRKH